MRNKLRRSLAFLLSAVMIVTMSRTPVHAVADSEQLETGLCEHHTTHTGDCGYKEETPETPCSHEHTEDCYIEVTECVHEHTPECYPAETEDSISDNEATPAETEDSVSDNEATPAETEDSVSDNEATPANTEEREPENCSHICDGESGCITEKLDCQHEHDGKCGYTESILGAPCTFVCEICNPQDSDRTDEEPETGIVKQEQCSCLTLCTEGHINPDCPVCGMGEARLSDCRGKTAEENPEQLEDSSICKHHQEHDDTCGYQPTSEDEEGSPCTYDCRICPIEDLIAALPDKVTEDNAEEVWEQLDKIIDLYQELTGEEQEQIDISRCLELQEYLDETNVLMPLADGVTGNVVLSGMPDIRFTADVCGENCGGHIITQNVPAISASRILVESGTHNITFQGLNIITAQVGVMPGATMNLTLEGSNTINGYECGIYVPVDATLVITAESTGSLNVSGKRGAGIGGAYYAPNDGDGDINCGTVVINGGTINATGGGMCAGIGGAAGDTDGGNGGTVIINGGTVTATGGSDQAGNYGGAGIGGSSAENPYAPAGSGGRLTINGGKVTLIHGQYSDQVGTAYGFGKGSGASSSGTCELILADESCLTVDSLDPKGTYTINAAPTADMIMVPTNLVYNGQVQDLNGKIYIDDTKTGKGTYFNQEFTVNASAEGWTYTISPVEVKKAGDYTVTFSKEGHTSISKTLTVAQSGTKFENGIKTYNGETETTSFTANDIIKVVATPTPTGAAPTNSAMFAASFTAPSAGQMAVFVNDTQVSEPVDAGADGSYTMTVSAAEVLLQGNAEPNGNAITLTAKFVENGNMADAAGTANVTISAVAKAENPVGTVIGYYDASSLASAFAAENDGAAVTLLGNVNLTTCLNIPYDKTFTLDLNGQTITRTVGNSVEINDGSALTIKDSGTNGQIISTGGNAVLAAGTLTLEGGTFISGNANSCGVCVKTAGTVLSVTGDKVSIQNTAGGPGLGINYMQSVTLTAGTYGGIQIADSSKTLAGLLGTGCAYYSGDTPSGTPIKRDDLPVYDGNLGATVLDGTITVKQCGHEGGLQPDGSGYQHGGACPYCGAALTAENHTAPNGSGKCDGCGATLVAKMELNGTRYYDHDYLASAFAAENDGATVTLLGSVELASTLKILSNTTFTLDLNGQTITSSDDPAVRVYANGKLTIKDSGTNGQIISTTGCAVSVAGTLTLEGGAFIGGAANDFGVDVNYNGAVLSVTSDKVSMQNAGGGYGLGVNDAQAVTLTAGTYCSIGIANSPMTLADLLGTGCAYCKDGKPLALEGLGEWDETLNGTVLTGPVTVGECSHEGGLMANDTTGHTHGGPCRYCNASLDAAEHTYDAEAHTCQECGAEIVAKVTLNDSTTYYTNIVPAFATENSGSKVTLLRDVDLGASYLSIPSGEPNTETTFILDCGAYTLSSSDEQSAVYLHRNSSLTFVGGTIKNTGSGSALTCDMDSKAFTMTGGTLDTTANDGTAAIHDNGINTIIRITGGTVGVNGSGLNIVNSSSLTVDSTRVQLSGGTYGAIYNNNRNIPLSTLLADGYAARGPAGLIRCDMDTDTLLGPITVEKCEHPGVTVTDNGGKHGMDCPYCGYSDSHTTTLTATADATANTVTLTGGCETADCDYTAELGKASFTFPALTCGETGDVLVTWDNPAESYYVLLNTDKQIDKKTTEASIPLTQLFSDAPLSVGEHTLTVSFSSDAVVSSNTCSLTFSVAHIPLTADMVMLPEDRVTYSGTEQRPTPSVQHGENRLEIDKDYDVSYTRDGVTTTDFTSAGTITVTVTGKGNYAGTVTKVFTITPATPTVVWNPTYQELTYTGQQTAITEPTVTLVNNESFSGTIHYSYTGTTSGTGLPTNAGTYTIKASIAAEGNYTAADSMNELTLTINKAPAPAITWPAANDLTYGQKLSESTLSGGSTEYGSFAWTNPDTVPTAGTSGYSMIFTSSDSTEQNYETITSKTQDVNITVAQATPTVTVAAKMSDSANGRVADLLVTVIGAQNGVAPTNSITLTGDGLSETLTLQNGEATYKWENLSDKKYTVTATYSGDTNYKATNGQLTFDAAKKNQEALAISPVEAKTYGDPAFTLATTGGSGTGAVSFISSDPSIISINGNTAAIHKAGDITITATKAGDAAFNPATATMTISVGKKEVVFKAQNVSVHQGDAMPAFTYVPVTLAAGDRVETEPTAVCTATDTDTSGTFTITFSDVVLTNQDNYIISYEPGTLTITSKPLPPDKYSITVQAGTGGTASASPISAEKGTKITLNATPDSGYHFKEWQVLSGGVTISGNSFTMPAANVTIKAVFEQDSDLPQLTRYSVTVQAGTGGTASASPTSAEKGTKITLNATPDSGYYFKEWQVLSGGVTISGNSFTMPAANVTIKAVFERNSNSGGNSGGSSSSGDNSSSGGSTIVARPDETKPEIPTTSQTKPAAPDKNGNVAVNNGTVQSAINTAKNDAKKNGNTTNGVAVVIPITPQAGQNSFNVTIKAQTMDTFVHEDVKRLEININGMIVGGMDASLLKWLDSASANGDIILRVKRLDQSVLSKEAKAAIGTRPFYDLSLVYLSGGKEIPITNFDGHTITVRLPYTPAKEEQAGNLYAVYVDGKGKVEWLTKSSYDPDLGMVVFETGYFSIYGIGYKNPAPAFTDIKNHWAEDNIIFIASRGLLSGTGNKQFSPNTSMTRGMFVTALGRLAGINPADYKTGKFTDVKVDVYYAPYVNWAAEKGIVNGTTTTTFSPDTNITREQMAVIMVNYAKKLGYELPVVHEAVTFADNAQISDWTVKEVKAMQQADIMAGKGDNLFDPKGTATRAEVATVLRRFVEIIIDPQIA